MSAKKPTRRQAKPAKRRKAKARKLDELDVLTIPAGALIHRDGRPFVLMSRARVKGLAENLEIVQPQEPEVPTLDFIRTHGT
jgi:hypothetical protein